MTETDQRRDPENGQDTQPQVSFDSENIIQTSSSPNAANGTDNGSDEAEKVLTRTATLTPRFRVETRAFAHKYYIRRPRALQYFQDGQFVGPGISRNDSNEVQGDEDVAAGMWLAHKHRINTAKIPLPENVDADSRSTDVPVIQRRRLDLFTDLLWVGIASNISERFSDSAFAVGPGYGQAFLEFIVLFFVAWQIWNYLRDFLNSFFVDDLLQRTFIMWILILALLYGNSAKYFNDSKNATEVVITLYLIARASFTMIESVYMIFLPRLRMQHLLRSVASIPVVGLFIGSIFVPWPTSLALYFPAIILESFLQTLNTSPIQDALLRGQIRKAPDPEHLIERFESFFIIILGEGVFLLIKSSPLGLGVGTLSGSGLMVLAIYYFLLSLYFAGDSSRNYIHAVRKTWLSATLWQLLHIFMYCSILLMDASWLYLIQNSSSHLSSSTTSDLHIDAESADSAPEVSSNTDIRLLRAKWTASASLATALVAMTLIALLNRSLDPPNTLMVNNRYLRILPRVLAAIALACINLKEDLSPQSLTAIVFGIMYFLAQWEWYAGLEKGAKLIEPKRAEE